MRQRIRSGLLLLLFCIFPAVFYYLSPYLIIDGTMHGTNVYGAVTNEIRILDDDRPGSALGGMGSWQIA